MTKLFMFEKPLGMRDTLPALFEAKRRVRANLMNETELWGFRFIETPALEYYETIGEASAIMDSQLFKLLDRDGRNLVLRPDMTAPIARVAASKLLKEQNPVRLAYCTNVYRAQEKEGGRPAEFEQFGVELVGDKTVSADAEVIALMMSVLNKAGVDQFHVAIGHIGFVQALMLDILGTEERASVLRQFLYEKNYVGYRVHVDSLPLSSIDKQRLVGLLDLKGGPEILRLAKELIDTPTVEELEQLLECFQSYDDRASLTFDLSLVSHMHYYTGILFEVYGITVGFPLGNGGRYNELYKKFGQDVPSTGFGLRLDRMMEEVNEIHVTYPPHCVVFSRENRVKAYKRAQTLRESGTKVILQDINGVEDVDALTKQYTALEFYIGHFPRKEGQS